MNRRWASLLLALAMFTGACTSDSSPTAGASTDSNSTDSNSTDSNGTDAAESDSVSDGSESPVNEPDLGPGLSDDEQVALEAGIALYLDQRGTNQAIEFIELMQKSGDITYAPFLVDLLRLGNSGPLADPLAEALRSFSGIEPTGAVTQDFALYGSWLQSAGIDPAPGYREFKLGLYERADQEFVALLDSIESDAELALIHWGGAPRGGIPELNDQERIPAAQADWMTPDELVLGVEIDDVAVAYPLRILARHELANDTVAGIPISVVFCTLCRSGLTFDRRVEGQVIDFETSGLLANSNKIMVDRQTDTLWRHLQGVGFAGELSGVELVQYPTITTTWADWLSDHPGTETLTFPAPIFFDDPERPPIAYDYTPGAAYENYYNNPNVWFPILDTPDTFELKSPVVGIESGDAALALELEALVAGPPRWFAVGELRIVVVPTDAGARVYDATSADLPGQSGDEIDEEIVETDELEQLAVEQSFWFAWFSNHPETATWPTT